MMMENERTPTYIPEAGPQQLKSKQRVADHGEVFTSAREVAAMLDLVKNETERIDSRFLEPACGTGNFLVAVLRRKLAVVDARYSSSPIEWERYAILALSSIYGVDLLADNVAECRQRLYAIWNDAYTAVLKGKAKDEARATARYILSKNILWGDALTMRTPVSAQMPLPGFEAEQTKPIVFAEWNAVNGSMIKRRDYTLSHLLESGALDGPNLFSDLGDQAFIPQVYKDYPLTHYLRLNQDLQD